ncbi:hypothetical protein EIK77_004746 [Talaromyces pinophilus]|uniref:Mediator of RNA polymerase II transcription subunit 9 n=1 Tax=Talaromyces pinophilus TaxID=128442 RepID=A0A6V8HIK7_TALPI|nr:hypothetical protein EIK77_004746 [Talaromyces pinophilus]PCG90098.1 Mediator complex, subunit Med9 [Penicillium occitanis (nom. inval.)]PCH08992.1 hypothetical protein PENOC_011620 [Penicillium occitanis (nom. inval.)]GAM41265.1 hypothetical protein TCE0_042r14269 [Talaromyces pinophilus]
MASRSPVSAVSQQQKISSTPDIAPTSPPTLPTGQATTVAQAAVPFPSPQTFDFLPPLHALILRLLSSTNTSASNAAAAATSHSTIGGNASVGGVVASQTETGSQTQQKQSQSQHLKSASHSQIGAATDSATPSSNLPPPLEAKDLFTAASAIRIRIQKARAVVEGLPDVDRTTEEQDDEIEELMARITSLRGVIADFGRRAGMQQTVEGDTMDVGV